PLRYILLTQYHVDHVGGVDLLREEGTELVAQAENWELQVENAMLQPIRAGRSIFAFAETIGKALAYMATNIDGPIPPQSQPQPTVTFRDDYRFELGGLELELISVPGGETTDSMLIWLPQHKICFSGNLFSALFGHFPNLVTIRGDRYRDATSFIHSLDKVLELEPELLLVGHGGPIEGKELIREELTRLRAAVQFVHDAVVEGMNAGKTVYRLMGEIELPPELEVGQGYGKLSWSIRAIWENYMGWFHARSTTELYPVPPSNIHPDLVELAGGAAAVAERAEAKLAQGLWVEAISLAEIALGVEPKQGQALKVSLAAHEALLKESQNFWESSWLQNQINLLHGQS
ncbi:MAG: MBL fold metallo-hydrolase, partial [Deltaproteobacteria bacterium]|nr:MBL fold metallo-hydrolase [Deltaproteobacteria bacterium]